MYQLRTLIVEDEETSRAILRNYLTKYCPKVEIVGEAENIEEALTLIRNNELDLVFLDVEMPRGNAFDLLEQVGDRTFETMLDNKVLTTSVNDIHNKITIPVQDGFEVIPTKDILYCQADDNYTQLYLISGKKKLISKTLKYFEEALVSSGFARVHKSYLVNVNEIVSYKKGKGGSVVLSSGKEVMVSASQKANLLSYFK